MVLEVEALSKSFGRRRAVSGISFSVQSGEVVGLLGPNGAGKTTTMRMIAGYLEPDEGFAKIFGIDVAQAHQRGILAPRQQVEMLQQNPHRGVEPVFFAQL